MTTKTITPKALHDLVESGAPVDLIDVRTPAEYGEVHVSFARNVPLDQLDPQAIAAGRNGSGKPLYVICRCGNRAAKACERILAAGLTSEFHVQSIPTLMFVAGGKVVAGTAGLIPKPAL